MRRSFAVLAALSLGLPIAARADVLPSDVILIPDTGNAIAQAGSLIAPAGGVQKAACALFQHGHPDRYDMAYFFTTATSGSLTGTPDGFPIVSDAKGIGMDTQQPWGTQKDYCTSRLRHAVKAGTVAEWPDDPDAVFTATADMTLTGVQAMAHEFGHHWMAYASYDLNDGGGARCDLRAQVSTTNGNCQDYGVHWSAFFNSGGIMFGNKIEDQGGGNFRIYNDGKLKFGALDQYLMGLLLAEQVGPLLLVDPDWTTVGNMTSMDFPLAAGTEKIIQGDSVGLTIDDVIRAMGTRRPPLDQCHWKGAVVLVVPPGTTPDAAAIAKVATYATRMETFYAEATDQHGSIDLTADGRGTGTAGCPGQATNPGGDGTGTPDEAAAPDVATPDAADGAEADAPADVVVPAEAAAAEASQADPGADERLPAGDALASPPDAPAATDPGGSASATGGASSGGCAAGTGAGPGGLAALALLLAAMSRRRARRTDAV